MNRRRAMGEGAQVDLGGVGGTTSTDYFYGFASGQQGRVE